MLIYSGEPLDLYKKENLQIDPDWNERDFTALVRNYLEGKTEKVLAISGLRGTGKTVGCLQASGIRDTTYILAQKGDGKTGRDYIDTIRKTKSKCILIDEYSWIEDRKELDQYLLTAIQNGHRIVLTGTESITLDLLNYGTLYHRIQAIHTTMFPYGEYLRVYGKSHSKETCREYLTEGGLFKEYAIKNYDGMREYIETAIVGNLAGYLKNEMSEETARTLTYAVLYLAICPSNLSAIPMLRNENVTMENFLDLMGINPSIKPDQRDIHRVADLFEETGIIVRIPNYNRKSPRKEQYYIVNPSLTCQLIMQVYGLDTLENALLGHVFESCVGVQLSTNRLFDHNIFFYNNEGASGSPENRELDLIITDKKEDHAFFFECKYSQSAHLKPNTTLLSGYLEANEFQGIDIEGRYVIYNGRPRILEKDVGKIIFTPIGDMLDNYFQFETNVKAITEKTSPVKTTDPR